jgi:type I restriction enzyme S subunit
MSPNGLPGGWHEATLGEIRLDRSTSIDPSKHTTESFELYSIPAYPSGRPEVVVGGEVGSTKKSLYPGTVIVSKINPRINRVWVVGERNDHRQIGSSEWIAFFPRAGLEPEYLAYFMRQDAFRNYLAANVSGVGGSLMRVRPSTVDPYPFVLAPLPEQHRIVSALESYFTRLDDAVETLERVQRNLKRYRASVLKAAVEGRLVLTEADLARAEGRSYEPASMLLKRILAERRRRWEETELAKMTAKGNAPRDDKWKAKYVEPFAPGTSELPELPESWCWASIEQLASRDPRSIQSGPFGSNLLHSEFRQSGKLVVGIDNVQDGYFSMGSENRISESKFQVLEKYRARAGDVLITVMATIGRCCVIPDDLEPAIITKHVYRISPHSEIVNPRYLHLAIWGGPVVRAQIFGKAQGQTRPGLNGTIIRRLCIPLPPRAEQDRIVMEAERLLSLGEESADALMMTTRRSTRLRQSILKWAFEGRLVDQDPTDEPASVLLERIRADRSARSESESSPQLKSRRRPSSPTSEG